MKELLKREAREILQYGSEDHPADEHKVPVLTERIQNNDHDHRTGAVYWKIWSGKEAAVYEFPLRYRAVENLADPAEHTVDEETENKGVNTVHIASTDKKKSGTKYLTFSGGYKD